MVVTAENLLTVGDIAKIVNEPIHRCQYLLKSRDINPIARLGNHYVYDTSAVSRIQQILAEVDASPRCRMRD
jgi:hypothetical protein